MATQRQRAAMAKILEKPGSVSAAMREVGYSENTARNPSDLTESKGFRELMDEAGMTDSYLLEKHRELMEKQYKGDIDSFARTKALEMAYKIKGTFASEKLDHTVKVIPIMGGKSIQDDEKDRPVAQK